MSLCYGVKPSRPVCYEFFVNSSSNPLTRPQQYDIITELTAHSVKRALLAQLDRVTGYEPVGRGFESLAARIPKTHAFDEFKGVCFFAFFETKIQ